MNTYLVLLLSFVLTLSLSPLTYAQTTGTTGGTTTGTSDTGTSSPSSPGASGASGASGDTMGGSGATTTSGASMGAGTDAGGAGASAGGSFEAGGTARGTIVSVDAANNRFTVRGDDGTVRTLSISDQGSLDGLNEGDSVSINLDQNDPSRASSIQSL